MLSRVTLVQKLAQDASQFTISAMLNYCKLTFEFFKNIVFEKRRQFLNRVISATDGGVQKHYRVFRSKNSLLFYLPAVLGGDVAACRPSCSSVVYDTLKAR